MTGEVWVTPSEPSDAFWVAREARQVDRAEWAIASGRLLTPCIEAFIERADGLARTMWLGPKPLCIWGAGPMPEPGVGSAWLIGTDRGARHARRVQRHWRAGIAELHERFPALVCWAWEKNELHHFWLERLGFARTGDARLLGLGGTFIELRKEL